ncbi:MAG: ABC transporter ATP-binding protein [Puniceicoccaceae bacterium]
MKHSEPLACSLGRVAKTFHSGLRKRFIALRGIDFAVPRGSVSCLLGPNGSGKSTSIRILLGLTRPDSGVVEVFGQPPSTQVRQRIGYLPEAPWFPPQLTASETLRLSGALFGLTRTEVEAAAAPILERLRFQPEALKRPLRTYSKGMLQKVALCQALIHKPDLIILDEPTAGLDPVVADVITTIIQDLRTRGTSILLCSHDLEQVAKVGDTYTLLHAGKVFEVGEVGDGRGPKLAFERIIEMENQVKS